MELLGIGILVMIGVDAFVGVRLLALARQTRKLPELALGGSFLLLGGVGYPLSILARRWTEQGQPGGEALLGVALLAQNLACLGVYLFTWRTFRPDRSWAAALVTAAGCCLALSLLAPLLGLPRAQGWDGGPGYLLGFGPRFGAFVWSAWESGRCAAMLRRQRRVGLADPVVVDRVWLWAVTSTSVAVAFAIFLVARLAGLDVAASPWVLLPTSVAGLVAGVSTWLAFVPPRRYLSRILARAPA